MARDRYDVVVIGLGVMGAATTRALVKRGLRVCAVEQFQIGHKRGSSHGASRIFRLSYPDARYVSMAQQALELWRELESEAGESLLTTTGGVDSGKPLDDHVHALSERGAAFELLEAKDAQLRWPMMRVPAGEPVLFQPDGGIVAADAALKAFTRCAVGAGAAVRDRARACRLDHDADKVTVEVGGSILHAGAVVITAGAWAKDLAGSVGINVPVRPTRETVAYFELDGPLPPTLVEWGAPSVYALPSPGQGIKVGEHVAGPTADPDEEGVVSSASVERLSSWVGERFPTAASSPHHAETCLYTNTTDEHFVLERRGRIVVGSPCSGHGFKFAPWVGEYLAALAEDASQVPA